MHGPEGYVPGYVLQMPAHKPHPIFLVHNPGIAESHFPALSCDDETVEVRVGTFAPVGDDGEQHDCAFRVRLANRGDDAGKNSSVNAHREHLYVCSLPNSL